MIYYFELDNGGFELGFSRITITNSASRMTGYNEADCSIGTVRIKRVTRTIPSLLTHPPI